VVVETQLPGLLLKFLVFGFELLDSILLECHFLLKEPFVGRYLLFELILLCLEGEKDGVKSTVEVILVDSVGVLEDGVFGGRGAAETKVWWGEMHWLV
jgi:hypothetical protein